MNNIFKKFAYAINMNTDIVERKLQQVYSHIDHYNDVVMYSKESLASHNNCKIQYLLTLFQQKYFDCHYIIIFNCYNNIYALHYENPEVKTDIKSIITLKNLIDATCDICSIITSIDLIKFFYTPLRNAQFYTFVENNTRSLVLDTSNKDNYIVYNANSFEETRKSIEQILSLYFIGEYI
jgi:hypothetical protein